jgi:hypothetical protein
VHTATPTDPATHPRRRSRRPSTNGANGDADPPGGSPSPNGANGRDAHGRFAKGNPGGPGNPFARRVAALRRALCETVTEDDVRAITCKLLQQARDGDPAAVRVLFAYAIGRPTDAVNPDTLDLQEWQMYRLAPAGAEELEGLARTLQPEMACRLARAILPHIADTMARNFVEGVRAKEAEEAALAAEEEDDEEE